MADRLSVGVRYCGGCNPRYDRVAAVSRLAALCPEAELSPAGAGQVLTLLVCGCPAQCAQRDDLPGQIWTLTGPEDVERAAGRLRTLV